MGEGIIIEEKSMYENRFLSQLKIILLTWRPTKGIIKKAENLSLEIHNAEGNGYLISPAEDRKWKQVTALIQGSA